VIEHKDDVEMIMRGLHYLQEQKVYDDPPDVKERFEELLNEIYKIQRILEKTNHS
jgi:hypothetical protein